MAADLDYSNSRGVDELSSKIAEEILKELRKWYDSPEESNIEDEEDESPEVLTYVEDEEYEPPEEGTWDLWGLINKIKKKRNRRRKIKKKAKRSLIRVNYNANHKYVDMEKKKKRNMRRKIKKNAKRSLIVDDDLLVSQILSRLPVKSLTRFKCVCKQWKSVIEHDQHFISLHNAYSEARPGLLIIVPSSPRCRMDYTRDCESFLSADLHSDGKGANVHTIRKIQPTPDVEVLGPVRGFICLVDNFAVQIYNVSTGEATPWIKSRLYMNFEKQNVTVHNYERPKCYFGFDPSTGNHKVIFIWWYEVGNYEGRPPVCEVLTVGDDAWRIIDEVPPCKPEIKISAYANGSIYWFMYIGIETWRYSGEWPQAEYSESLMAFDMGSEKFRVIPIPTFTILEYSESSCSGLLEMDGCVTFIRRKDHKVKMWKFHDHNKEKNGTSTNSSEKDWTEVNIRLPSDISYNMFIYFHSSIAGKELTL